jgi:hypothetical protein
MSKRGIRAETSEQHTPVRNGEYERTNKTIVEGALYLLHINYLPLDQEAISVAVHTLNRVITKTAPNTPFQNEYGLKKILFYVILDLRGEKWIQRVWSASSFGTAALKKSTIFGSQYHKGPKPAELFYEQTSMHLDQRLYILLTIH